MLGVCSGNNSKEDSSSLQKEDSLAPLFNDTTLLGAFATIAVTVFIAELTDKDALLLLALATKIRPLTVFLAGSIAFTITTAIIVSLGYLLSSFISVFWIKLAGGVIMISYAVYQYLRTSQAQEKKEIEEEEEKIAKSKNRAFIRFFLGIISMLVVLDLAGDATEVLTVVFVARYQNLLLVFISCVVALTSASLVETIIGNRLGKLFSIDKIRIFSLIVFLMIGSVVVATTLLFP